MSVVDEVKQRLDIVDIIGNYVNLEKSGHNYKGLCPFHSEKTPSFVVFPDTQSWHCFGACSTGGDIFSFVMQYENMDFSQALRMLAQRAGIELRPLSEKDRRRKDRLERLRAINLAATRFYHNILRESPEGEPARRYLGQRGVESGTMTTFQLGYAPNDWHRLHHHLEQEGFGVEEMLAAGVLSSNDQGRVYDRFRGRVLFPIRDRQGHVIGFGGRVLDNSAPKYLNTPQTDLFDKSSVLYGIDLARQTIRETSTAVIVEGYMDVVIPYQAGVTNLVACMGTALTEQHIDILKGMADRLILALDPDEAGMRAVAKGTRVARQSLPHRVVPVPTASGLVQYEERLEAEIRILTLPDGLDPDELILKDRNRWDDLVENAQTIGDYFFQLVMSETDTTTAKGKRRAVERLMPVLSSMDNPVERTHYVQQLAQAIRMDERQLLAQLRRLRRGQRRSYERQEPEASPKEDTLSRGAELNLEERCLGLLLRFPELVPAVKEHAGLLPETFQDARRRQTFLHLQEFLQTDAEYEPRRFLETLDSETSSHIESILRELESGPPLTEEMVREDLLKSSARLRRKQLSTLIEELRFMQQEAEAATLNDRARQLERTIEDLTRDYLELDRRFYAATFVGRRHFQNHGTSHAH